MIGLYEPQRMPMQTAAPSAGHEHPAQLDVGVVGAGRVGTALAVALSRAGHRVAGGLGGVRRRHGGASRSSCRARRCWSQTT